MPRRRTLRSNLGKLHRVAPSRQAGMGGFMPAEGNPAATPDYALGLRSPWRGAYHPGKNWYFVAEVGPDGGAWEEINVVTRAGREPGLAQRHLQRGQRGLLEARPDVQKVMDSRLCPTTTLAAPAGRPGWARLTATAATTVTKAA